MRPATAALPALSTEPRTRARPSLGLILAEHHERKRRTCPQTQRENLPAFDLASELERILGVNAATIDGIDVMTIQTVLAEVGPDLSRWKTERHWTFWLNLAPQRDVSGGRVIRHVRQHHTNRAAMLFAWPHNR